MSYESYLIEKWNYPKLKFCDAEWNALKPLEGEDGVHAAGELIYNFLQNYREQEDNRKYFKKHGLDNEKALVHALFKPVAKHYNCNHEEVSEHFLRHYSWEFFGLFIMPKPQK